MREEESVEARITSQFRRGREKRGMGQGRLRLTVHREEDGVRVRRNGTRVKEKNKGCMRSDQCERRMNGGGKKGGEGGGVTGCEEEEKVNVL